MVCSHAQLAINRLRAGLRLLVPAGFLGPHPPGSQAHWGTHLLFQALHDSRSRPSANPQPF